MENQINVHTKPAPRQAKLKAWLAENQIIQSRVADSLGLSRSALSDIIAGRRAKPEHISALVSLGWPANLLPDPREPGRPGRKPGCKSQGKGANLAKAAAVKSERSDSGNRQSETEEPKRGFFGRLGRVLGW